MDINEKEGPLQYEGDTDYTLKKDDDWVWITVGELSVKIARRDFGIDIDVWELNKEMDTTVHSISVNNP